MKPVIKEVIVVEGHHDSEHLKRFYACETIETHGLGLDEKTIEAIRREKERRGVIIFTDPDGAGNQIRNRINQEVDGCKNAFLLKEDARTVHKVGVEHASFSAINQALTHLVTLQQKQKETIGNEAMLRLGLLGSPQAGQRRLLVAKVLCLGEANAKTMKHRLNALGIQETRIQEILDGETDC